MFDCCLGHTKLIPSLPSFFFKKVMRAGGILFYFLFFSHQKSYPRNIINLGLWTLRGPHIKKMNCAFISKLVTLGASLSTILNRSFLFKYTLHCVRKCTLSSTFVDRMGKNVLPWVLMGVYVFPFLLLNSGPIVCIL